MRQNRLLVLLSVLFICSGCAGTSYRTSPQYDTIVKNIKTIAVMPPDVKVYELSAGGVSQQMDEWSDTAKKNIAEALKKSLADRYEVKIKFMEENILKDTAKYAWRDNRALYNAISNSAYYHAFPGDITAFPHKVANFEYTLGSEIQKLNLVYPADAYLFIWGIDTELSGGRKAVEFLQAAIVGVYYIHPNILTMGLVNAKSGDLEWFSLPPAGSKFDFRNAKDMESLVECLTRSYLKKEK